MRAPVFAAILALILAACGAPVPPLPAVQAEEFPPSARAQVRELQSDVEAAPGDATANARLGMLLHAHERYDAALACYQRAASFGPGDPRWPYLQGAVRMSLGEPAAAAENFQTALAYAPHAPAFIRLGQALEAAGRGAESRKAFEDAIQLSPDAPAALLGLARSLAAEGNASDAIALLDKAVRLAPDAGAIYQELALAQRASGDGKAARLSFGMAKRFQRSQPPIDDPILDQVYALRRDPAWLVREGRRLEAAGDVETAASLYHEAVDQNPNYAPAHSSLVGALGLLGHFEEAEKRYLWALEVAPGMEDLHYNWGIVLAEQGDPKAAAESFRTALEINPDSADSHFNLGSMLAQLGRENDAVEEFEAAVDLDPGHRLALFQLAQRDIRSGRVDRAIPMLERALDSPADGRTAGILYALADAYTRKNDAANAILYARQALELALEFGDQKMAEDLARDLRGMTGGR